MFICMVIFNWQLIGFLYLVCQRIVEEIEKEISKIDPRKKSDVGSYRLDTAGEIKKTTASGFLIVQYF